MIETTIWLETIARLVCKQISSNFLKNEITIHLQIIFV